MKTRALIESIWDFEVPRRQDRAGIAAARRPAHQGIPPALQHLLPRRQAFPAWCKVNLADPIPRFQLTRMRKDDGARYFGPFAHAAALRATLNLMRDKFGLRSCRPYEPGEYDYKHCLAPVIKKCPAPCIGKISREDYRARVVQACEFLEGSVARDARRTRKTDEGRPPGEDEVREGGAVARHDRRPAAHHRADAPVHAPLAAHEHQPGGGPQGARPTRSRCRICRW